MRRRDRGAAARRENRATEDKSIRDKDLIHGMSVHGIEIDRALGPEDMRQKDAEELYNAALPGMFGSVGGAQLADDRQGATEMAASLLSTAIGKKAQIMTPSGKPRRDTLWDR